jgi:hypothetical protein
LLRKRAQSVSVFENAEKGFFAHFSKSLPKEKNTELLDAY